MGNNNKNTFNIYCSAKIHFKMHQIACIIFLIFPLTPKQLMTSDA